MDVFEWDELQSSVVVDALEKSSGAGASRRSVQVTSLVRFYVYYSTTDNLVRGSAVTEAENRAAEAFILSQYEHDVVYAWTVAQRNNVNVAPAPTTRRVSSTAVQTRTATGRPTTPGNAGNATVSSDASHATEGFSAAMIVIIGLIGVLTCLLFAIVILYQYRRYQTEKVRARMPTSFVSNLAVSTHNVDRWGQAESVLRDHGEGNSQWASNTSEDASVYDHIISALQGGRIGTATPSIAPSQAYVDYSQRPDTPFSNVPRRSITPANPKSNRYSGMSIASGGSMSVISDGDAHSFTSPMDDGYLKVTNGQEVNISPTKSDGTHDADSAMESLLQLKQLCAEQLSTLEGSGDAFDSSAKSVLLATKHNIETQVEQLRSRQLVPDDGTDPTEAKRSGRASAMSTKASQKKPKGGRADSFNMKSATIVTGTTSPFVSYT